MGRLSFNPERVRMTITEALAEIKTTGKRIAKKREAVACYIARQDNLKDPLANDGGSVEFIKRERQAIGDLENRIVELRAKIAAANARTGVTVEGETRSVADWLTYRREVAPGQQQFLNNLRGGLDGLRKQVAAKGLGLVNATATVNTAEVKPTDVWVNISEKGLAEEIEHLETVLGGLDGQLSITNATTTI